MTTQTIQAPNNLRATPVPVMIGDVIPYDVPFYDGNASALNPWGSVVPVAAGSCSLVVNRPDGGPGDQTEAGTLVDLGSGQTDGFHFEIDTTGWEPGTHHLHVLYEDTQASPPVRRTVLYDAFEARVRGGDLP